MSLQEAKRQFDYLLAFTKNYQNTTDKYLREAGALKMQTAHILVDMQPEDVIAGRVRHGVVGFSPQYGGLYTYYYNRKMADELFEKYRTQLENHSDIAAAMYYWQNENTLEKLNNRFAEKHADLEKYKKVSGLIGSDHRFGTGSTPTGRLALTIPDLDKLVRLGLPGLRKELAGKNQQNTFIQALEIAVDTIADAAAIYEKQARELLRQNPASQDLATLVQVLHNIQHQAPATFLEGLQLYWIYSVFSDLMNHGRMDVYLGDLYAADLEAGRLDEETAIRYILGLYRHYKFIGKVHDTRVVVGGLGRRNEENADKLAMVIMEASRRFKDVVPQLTLRYYTGMNEALYDKALQVNAEGCSFPLLYSDDTNIPAIQKVFGVTQQEAETYIPGGCGEYILEARSIGTPNSGINLQKALELALHEGKDWYYKQPAGPNTGKPEDFETFEQLWAAFACQIDHDMAIVAWAQKECYNLIAENAAYLHLSLLMDDCVQREKPIFEGGVRYLNGTTEIMGMITAADSLTAIKKLVYDDKVLSLRQVVAILDANFEGYDKERAMMKAAPKYGNDDPYADDIALRVFNFVSELAISYTSIIDINRFNIVSVNNSESAVWGTYTMASACGRKNYEAMANANGASIGCDTCGITALLNSMSKFDHSIHAGVINNVRFSKSLFQDSYGKMKVLIRTFFENNGSQMNLMVVGRDDLINAKKNPEQYQNLIIRIGGFSARFVELDPVVQDELINRTTYAS